MAVLQSSYHDFMSETAGADYPPTAEPLFVMRRGNERLTCRLRNVGDWGHESQFHIDGHLLMSKRFETRALAIAWAEQQRRLQSGQGWVDDPTAEWPLPSN
jgi:hypothetical protein